MKSQPTNRLPDIRRVLKKLKLITAMPRGAEIRGTVSTVTVKRDGGVAITIYLLPIDRSEAMAMTPGTPVVISQ